MSTSSLTSRGARLKTWGALALCMLGNSVQPMAADFTSFASYQAQAYDWIKAHRQFQTDAPDDELQWNGPAEWRPATPATKGIILVHGLGDSPWSLVDIGQQLAHQGFLVRTILLEGHGTKPQDLIDAHIDLWRQTLAQQVAILKKEVDEVYLGGFSTGANLVTSHAIMDRDIAGLLLYSPAFKSRQTSTWALPLITWFKPWLRDPDDGLPQQTPLRYLNTPTNGFLQFYRSSMDVQDKLRQTGFDRPALLVLAEHDSVVDTQSVLASFKHYFTHPGSRLIWYGDMPHEDMVDARVLVETDYLPEERISQFSHMGILFSPQNPLYGRAGRERFCRNGLIQETYVQCLLAADEDIWYSDWGYQEDDKIYARLTFNPYFDWQSDVTLQVLSRNTSP